MVDTFDPRWLDSGEFDLSEDSRPSRTQRMRDHLASLDSAEYRLVPNPSRGRACTYYIRERSDVIFEAQYVMGISPELPALDLGISVEKGREDSDAPASRRMDRGTWDWPRLMRAVREGLDSSIADISRTLERPVVVWMDTHGQEMDEDGEVEDAREEWNYVFTGHRWLLRGVPVTLESLAQRLQEIERRRHWWSDVWIFCEFGPSEVENMTVTEAAQLIHAFKPLRDTLRAPR